MTNAYSFRITWPIDGKDVEIRIEPNYYKHLLIYWPNDFKNLEIAYEVLQNPNRIFSGLKRPYSNSSNKLCIVGKPRYWYVGKESIYIPFPTNLVYLVFLNERKSLYEFRAEKSDIGDPLSPENWENRFRELIWKKNS